MLEAYNTHFGMPVGDSDKPRVPHLPCELCQRTLEGHTRARAHSSFPLTHSVQLKEEYSRVNILLDALKYEE